MKFQLQLIVIFPSWHRLSTGVRCSPLLITSCNWKS